MPLLLLFVRSALSKSLVYGISSRNASLNKEKLGNNINTSPQEEGKKYLQSSKTQSSILLCLIASCESSFQRGQHLREDVCHVNHIFV